MFVNKLRRRRSLLFLLTLTLLVSFALGGCGTTASNPAGPETPNQEIKDTEQEAAGTIKITDMIGREVEIPRGIERVAAWKHLGTLVFGLGQQDKLIHQGLLNATAKAMSAVDPEYAALPYFKSVTAEELLALNTQLVFAYQDSDPNEIDQLTEVGIPVIVLKGETLEESYEAARLIGKALECEDKAEEYINACQGIVDLVQERIKDVPEQERPKVFYAGPKSIYTAASGDMLQNTMIKLAGGINVAEETIGKWAQISPEQLIQWNPDVLFLGSSLGEYQGEDVFSDSALQTVNAVKNKEVYLIPSNIGWWDFPAPHCVLGIQFMATKLYPDRFEDIDMLQVADDFYLRFIGRSFTELGGKI